jgi:hypothetical protein
MKYKGKTLTGLNTDILVLPKGDMRVVIKAQAIQNYNDFDELVSIPEPPVKVFPGGVKEKDLKNPTYLLKMEEYSQQKLRYMFIKSLEATEEFEWEKVDLKNPASWKYWEEELEDAGFTEIERMRILNLCTQVNCLDDALLDQAKEDFLAGALPVAE